MILSKQKIKYALEKAEEIIRNSKKYKHTQYSLTSTMTFEDNSRTNTEVKIEFGSSKEVKEVLIGRNYEDLKIDTFKGNEDIVEKIKKSAIETIQRIENEKYLKMFPEYDITLDRDLKLEELLSGKIEEVKEEVKEVKKEKRKWGIF